MRRPATFLRERPQTQSLSHPPWFASVFLPHVALLSLLRHQQISMRLIHQLWSDPTQGHVHLLWRHIVIILHHGRRAHRCQHVEVTVAFNQIGWYLWTNHEPCTWCGRGRSPRSSPRRYQITNSSSKPGHWLGKVAKTFTCLQY